jgi:hypothetical protein
MDTRQTIEGMGSLLLKFSWAVSWMYIQNSSSGKKNKYAQIEIAAQITGNSRLDGCGRNLAPSTSQVCIKQSDSSGPFYEGLYRCGQVWLCPDCSERIMHVRSAEISKAEHEWKSQGGRVWMLTLTLPHQQNERLEVVLARLSKARQKMCNLRIWKRLSHEFAGNIRSLEITYGNNGWHPHFHVLLFLKEGTVVEPAEIESVWRIALYNTGITGDLEKSANVLTTGSFANYVCGSKSDTYSAATDKTPFGLLSSHNKLQNKRALMLFVEYSEAIKGKRKLLWSAGLRKLLKIDDEKTDEEIVTATIIAEIDKSDWKIICKSGSRDLVLHAAECDGQIGVLENIALLRDLYG